MTNWRWMLFFVGRYLRNNQLKELHEDIFHNNTNLAVLWVDFFSYKAIPLSSLDKIDDQIAFIVCDISVVGRCRLWLFITWWAWYHISEVSSFNIASLGFGSVTWQCSLEVFPSILIDSFFNFATWTGSIEVIISCIFSVFESRRNYGLSVTSYSLN